MSATNIQLVIDFLLKNKEQVLKVLEQLKEQYGIDIDTTSMDQAFGDLEEKLEGLEGSEVEIDGNSSGAVDAAEDAEAAVDEVPEEHETTFKGDGANLQQTVTAVSTAYTALMQIVSQVKGEIGELINLSGEQEKAENLLQVSLKNTGETTDESFHKFKNLAASFQEVTTIGDEVTMGIMHLGLNMGVMTGDLEAATQGAIGLSKSLGFDLKTSMKMHTLAMGKDFTMLQRYLPALKTAKDDAEKMAIVKQAEANGWNLATSETESGYGALEQYANIVGDVKEKVGDLVKIVMIPFVKIIQSATEEAGNFFRSLTETSLEQTIRELSELGQSTLELELSLAKATQAKAEFNSIGLADEITIAKQLEDSTNNRVKLLIELGDLQSKMLLDEGKSEDYYRNIVALQEAAGTAGDYTVSNAYIEAVQKLKVIDALKEQITIEEDHNSKLQTDLILVQKSEKAKQNVLAFQEAINQSISEGSENTDKLLEKMEAFADKNIKVNLEFDNDLELEDDDDNLEEETNKFTEHFNEIYELKQEFNQRDYDLNTSMYQQQMDAIDEFYVDNKDKLKEAGFSEEQILRQSEQAKAKIRDYYAKKAISGSSKMLGDLAEAFKAGGKAGFETYKVLAISQTLTDTYASATAAYKSMVGIPVIGPALAVVASGAAIAAGMANVRQIKKQKFKAAKGTVLKGRSHSQGGINVRTPYGDVEAEGDEPILTGGVSRDPVLLAIASMINQAAGGDPLPGASKSSMGGGGITGSSSSKATPSDNSSEILQTLEAINANLIDRKPTVNIVIETTDPEARIKQDAETTDKLKEANVDI